VDRLADVIAGQAATSVDPDAYLRGLVNKARLPQKFRLQVLGRKFPDLGLGTRDLIRWAAERGVNPADPRFTTLGSLLDPVLQEVGADQAADLVAVMITERLVRAADVREAMAAQYQVPVPVAGLDSMTSTPVLGVDDDDGDEAVLQRLVPATPDLLDVGFLAEAIRRAASVCRVELRDGTAVGTGFLIDPGLALTNQHVADAEDPADLRLRFRCLSAAEGVVVGLDRTQPVAASSPVDALDFAALRLERPLGEEEGVQPLEIVVPPTPGRGAPLSILQHPNGGPLKLAITANGVVKAGADGATLRYVTATAGGSSGSPCFDEDWRPVAIHRAERATLFGAVREGVLLARIREQLGHLL
jgi:hypothetical protein